MEQMLRPHRTVPFRVVSTCLMLFALTLLGTSPLAGQFPPDSFVNLQVLPKDIEWRDLQRTMRGFNNAIGTNGCLYCHVGERGTPRSEWDFPSDDKLTKRKAREMIRMVRAMNTEHMSQLPGPAEPPLEVTCLMCHRHRSALAAPGVGRTRFSFRFLSPVRHWW